MTNFGCIIVRAIADEFDEGYVSKSTEETIFKLEDYNTKRKELNAKNVENSSKIIIGSMDIDKWYPSMIPAPSARGVREMFEKSKVEIAGINYDKVSKYLGEYLTEEEVRQEGMEEIVYMKIKKVKKAKDNVTKNIGKKHLRNKTSVTRKNGKTLDTRDTNKQGGGNVTLVTEDDKEEKALKTVGNVNRN